MKSEMRNSQCIATERLWPCFCCAKADGPKGHPARMVGPLRCVESISVFRLIQVNTLVPGRIMSYQDLMRSTVLLGAIALAAFGQTGGDHWVATWATSAQIYRAPPPAAPPAAAPTAATAS